jgi:hypothetical protein
MLPTSPEQVRYIYKTPGALLTYQIPDDDDQDGSQNIGSIQTPCMADSPRRSQSPSLGADVM